MLEKWHPTETSVVEYLNSPNLGGRHHNTITQILAQVEIFYHSREHHIIPL